MEYLQEADCFQLNNAGVVARQKGIIPKGQVLKCPHPECNRVECILLEDPLVRTIYFASKQTSQNVPNTPLGAFYERLEKYFGLKMTNTSG